MKFFRRNTPNRQLCEPDAVIEVHDNPPLCSPVIRRAYEALEEPSTEERLGTMTVKHEASTDQDL